MEATFEPQKTFPLDSKLQDKMEQLPETYGPNRTELWLRNYLKYDHQKYLGENAANKSSKDPQNQAYVASYQRVPQFLDEHMLSDKNMVMFHTHKDNSSRSEVVVDSFMFVLICQGKRDWHQRAFFIERIRQLVDQYSQFNVSVFDYDATIYDLIITVQVEMLKAVLITIACMTVLYPPWCTRMVGIRF
uniref:CRAL-TRIO domain-containing protein n=2 Tax=Ditylenchus dipsaci TaxID=166011 RepID=A0A915DHD9_9BILA